MARRSTIQIKGIRELKNKLGRLDKTIERKILSGIESSVTKMQSEAISRAPALGDNVPRKGGDTKSPFNLSGAVEKNIDAKSLTGTVSVEGTVELKYWASYTNFGTGTDAALYLGPLNGEWKRMAAQFIKDGKGRILHTGWFTEPALEMEAEAVSVMSEKLKDISL